MVLWAEQRWEAMETMELAENPHGHMNCVVRPDDEVKSADEVSEWKELMATWKRLKWSRRSSIVCVVMRHGH